MTNDKHGLYLKTNNYTMIIQKLLKHMNFHTLELFNFWIEMTCCAYYKSFSFHCRVMDCLIILSSWIRSTKQKKKQTLLTSFLFSFYFFLHTQLKVTYIGIKVNSHNAIFIFFFEFLIFSVLLLILFPQWTLFFSKGNFFRIWWSYRLLNSLIYQTLPFFIFTLLFLTL